MTAENLFRIDTRRRFLRDCAGGLGMIALGNLLTEHGLTAASEVPRLDHMAPKPPHFPRHSKECHLPVPGPVRPARWIYLIPSPDCKKWDGKTPSAIDDQRLEAGLHQAQCQDLGQPAEIQTPWSVRTAVFPICCRTLPLTRTTFVWSDPCTPRRSITPRVNRCS